MQLQPISIYMARNKSAFEDYGPLLRPKACHSKEAGRFHVSPRNDAMSVSFWSSSLA